ncbi:hypothetical protein [Streptomyces collinus]
MGSQAAWRLASRGAEVVGYERFAPGHDRSAAGGESRIFRSAHFEDSRWVPLLRHADVLWEQLQQETGRELRTPGPAEGARHGRLLQGRDRGVRPLRQSAEADHPHAVRAPRRRPVGQYRGAAVAAPAVQGGLYEQGQAGHQGGDPAQRERRSHPAGLQADPRGDVRLHRASVGGHAAAQNVRGPQAFGGHQDRDRRAEEGLAADPRGEGRHPVDHRQPQVRRGAGSLGFRRPRDQDRGHGRPAGLTCRWT